MNLRSYLWATIIGTAGLAACSSPGDGGTGALAEETTRARYCSGELPDPSLTPGRLCSATDPDFDGYRYEEHVPHCARRVSSAERDTVAANYRVAKADFSKYEFDHYIPLDIGGDNDIGNIWPQPIGPALDKDKLEDELGIALRNGAMTEAAALARIRAWRPNPLPIGCDPGRGGAPALPSPPTGALPRSVPIFEPPGIAGHSAGLRRPSNRLRQLSP